MNLTVQIVTVAFWLCVVALFGWIGLYVWNSALVVERLGEESVWLLNALLVGLIALTSGLLLALYRYIDTFVDPERGKTVAEVFYAMALFFALFFGLYSIFGGRLYG